MSSPLAALFRDLDSAFKRLSSDWYLFGAQAAIIHGAARLTADVDVTLLYSGGNPQNLITTLEEHGLRAQVENPLAFLASTRVLPVIHTATGMPVDIILGGPGLEEEFIQRASVFDIEGIKVPVASPEDIIVMKVLSGRPKDSEDVVSILATREVDIQYIHSLLGRLEGALDRSDLLSAFAELRSRGS